MDNTVRKGFRQAPTPTKGKVLEENFQLSKALEARIQNLEGQFRFLGSFVSQTMQRLPHVQSEVDRISLMLEASAKAGAAEKGDHVKIDYLGVVLNEDGSPALNAEGLPNYFDGGFGVQVAIPNLGSGTMIPGFEDQLVGVTAGQLKEVTVKFPKDYGAKELADKDAKFMVYVRGVYSPAADSPVETMKREYDKAMQEIRAAKQAAAEAKAKAEQPASAETPAEAATEAKSDEQPQQG